LLLTGARQAGKTSLLQHTFPGAAFVSLDLPSAAEQAEQSPGELLAKHDEPFLIDEVQYAPGLFRFLKAMIDRDRHRMGRFLMTGSQKFALMRSVSESLAGRCVVMELETLSAAELRATLGKRMPSAVEVIWRGGFPELYRNPDIDARVFYSSYVATYLERDVRLSLRISSLRDFERFLRACALRSAQLVNFSDLGRDVGVAASTVRDWLAVLESSNEVVLLEPYFSNLGKRMIKTPKLYLRDTGLLSFLLGIDSPGAMRSSPFMGAIWETFVLNEILRTKAASGSAAGIYFWRDAHGTEVDFVIEQAGRLRLIEAKWAESITQVKQAAALLKVRDILGKRAVEEHWIACRTPHAHTLRDAGDVRIIDGFRFEGWLDE
jgi:hypothetical protein